MGSRELYEAMIAGELKDVDVLMSSAADLQIRLANDGYAQRYASPYAAKLPSWAVWRNEVYGFTFEPAVIVYNPRRYTEATVPRSRQDLLRALERDKDKLHGRVGTYDISASSVGYLMAEQDELVSSNFWGLANAFGQVGVRLAATSAEILTPSNATNWTWATTCWAPTRCRARPPAATSAWSSRRTMCWCWRARC